MVIYAGVGVEEFKPATACSVAAGLMINPVALVSDFSKAYLDALNGMVEIANPCERRLI